MLSLTECQRLIRAKRVDSSVIESLKTQAAGNNAMAWRLLGVCYGDGLGVPKDLNARANCFIRAVELGDVSAMCTVSYSLENGSGGFVKNERAAYELAARAFRLALPKAYSDDECAYVVGRSFLYAEGGVEKDYKKAYEYLSISDRLGSCDAPVLLASMYRYGQYVPKDISKARRLLEKAVAMGNAVAAIDLKYL